MAVPALVHALCTVAGAILLYKITNVSGKEAAAYSGLAFGVAIFFVLGRKYGQSAILPSIFSGFIVALPMLVTSISHLLPSEDHVAYLGLLAPAYGALLGVGLGVCNQRADVWKLLILR